MTIYGIDASHHQGTVDWRAVAGAKDFAIIKATDGAAYSHTDWYRQNMAKMAATDLIPGAYHFLRTNSSGRDQARFFVETVGDFEGKLAVCDVETGPGDTHPGIRTVNDFATEFARLVPGHPLIIYTGRWYWVGILGDPPGAHLGPLWHSEYETSQAEVADGPESDNYGGWGHCTIWQYTSTGSCPGVGGDCDLNLFHGSRSELLALTGGTDDMTPDELRDELADGETRAVLKGLIQGAVLDGLRKPDPKNPDRGVLRPEVANLVADEVKPIVSALVTLTGKLPSSDLDEEGLATALAPKLLEALSPAAIAEAIPTTLAADVAEELAARLQG
jgi:GH25 family lysozyme M1 (1,4-beta-N-acetylmuramidase)